MPIITYQLNVQIAGGPKLSYQGTHSAEAYGVINVAVAASASDTEVELGTSSGDVTFYLITADVYKDVTYKVNSSSATDDYSLSGPMVLIGKGAVDLLDSAPTSLFLSNGHATEARNISVLVARDATP